MLASTTGAFDSTEGVPHGYRIPDDTTRHDIWKALLHNIGHSKRTQLLLVLVALFSMFTGYFIFSGESGFVSVLAPILGAVLFFVVLVLALLLSVKTETRVLAIDRYGIETRIGRKAGRIPWTAVDSIAATDELVIVTRKNTNFFAIPAGHFPMTTSARPSSTWRPRIMPRLIRPEKATTRIVRSIA